MSGLSLENVKVVDIGVGMPSALAAKFLRDNGATVTRFEAADDPFYDLYPAYRYWHEYSECFQLDGSDKSFRECLSSADICLVGGESHPELKWSNDADEISRAHPALVVLEISAFPAGHPEENVPAVDLLVQARSGLVFEHFSDRPIAFSFNPAVYGAALHGLIGLLAALYEREQSGLGQVVRASLFQGALTWVSALWSEAEHPDALFDFVVPKDPWPLIFKCADDQYIHLVMGSTGAKYRLNKILDIDDPTISPDDPGLPSLERGQKNFLGDIDALSMRIANWNSETLLAQLWEAGIAADRVLAPGKCWDDPQIATSGIIHRQQSGESGIGNAILSGSVASSRGKERAQESRPLSELVALDFGIFVAGPYATTLLTDLGVRVIKIEQMAGDPNRRVPRCFNSVNRGKRSISIDMKTRKGQEIIKTLCERADIITSNFRGGVAKRLGIDAQTLQEVNPDLIVLESTAYAPNAPDQSRAGFDLIFQALCGHEHRAGGVGNPPLWNRTTFVDYGAGLLSACAILLATIQRARGGGGAAISVPLVNSAMFFISELIRTEQGNFLGAESLCHSRLGFRITERIYSVRDGWIAISARGEKAARNLALALSLDALTEKSSADWGTEEQEAIESVFAQMDLDAAVDAMRDADVWAEPCLDYSEVSIFRDNSISALGSTFSRDNGAYGSVSQIGPLFSCSRSEVSPKEQAPRRGQHTEEVLSWLGYSRSEIEKLFVDKVVS